MPLTRDQLEDLVKKGLVADIFKMERAYLLLKTIGANASAINAPGAGNFGKLFGALQDALQTDAILAAARLYDPPSKKYATRCIRGLLDCLEGNSGNLPPIRERCNLERELSRIGMPPSDIQLVATDEAAFAKKLVEHFRAILDNPRISTIVGMLKDLRDKAIAHNEQAADIHGPTWSGLMELMQHAKDLAGVLGWAYLNTAYVINGEYIVTSDAGEPSRAMTRLLKRVIPSNAQGESATQSGSGRT
jgi:hypothetical protein